MGATSFEFTDLNTPVLRTAAYTMLGFVGSMAASCTEKRPACPAGTFCSAQVWPLSVDRHSPTFGPLGVSHVGKVPPEKTPIVVAAQSVVEVVDPAVLRSMRILETAFPTNGPALPNGLPVLPRSVQCSPPSS